MKVQKNTDYVSNANDVTRISAGVRLEGRLVSAGDVRVDGDVDGILYSGGRIVVGEGAGISGSIYFTNLDLLGKMKGDMFVKDVLSLKSSAVVDGNIRASKIQVEIGAQINGTCRMIDAQEYEKFSSEAVRDTPAGKADKPAKASDAAA